LGTLDGFVVGQLPATLLGGLFAATALVHIADISVHALVRIIRWLRVVDVELDGREDWRWLRAATVWAEWMARITAVAITAVSSIAKAMPAVKSHVPQPPRVKP
jgi:hypothetical protein